MSRQLALQTTAEVAAAAVPIQGMLRRKCACGTHTPGGGACPVCARSESLVRRSAVTFGQDPLLQRQEAPPEKPREERATEVAGGPEPESPGKLGKELLDRLEKALLPDTGSKVAAAAMAAGTLGALAANHEKLPMPIPIPLDAIAPGLSVKIGVNGPLDAPTGVMFNFNYKAPASGRAGQPTASEAYRAETARMAAEMEKLRPRPAEPAVPYQSLGIDTSVIAKSLGSSAAAGPGGLQLTLPPWSSFKRKRRGLLGDELKLEVPGLSEGANAPGVQRKLSIGASNDPLELEADRVAEQITTSPEDGQASLAPVSIQRVAARPAARAEEAPASVGRVLGSTGQPLDSATRDEMEQRFGHDFSRVRVHHGEAAEQSARDVHAQAYTVGSNIVFGAGQFSPGTLSGRRLLAHELTHVVQQHGAGPSNFATAALFRKPTKLGTSVTHTKGKARPFKSVKCNFDGATFTMDGDGTSVLSASAQSGRPNTVDAGHAKACGGSVKDSYLNNPRYVGIKDNGPIPEGKYSFKRSSMTQFTSAEQAKMALAAPGTYSDPGGADLHGDWGAGRAALSPITITPSAFCGDTSKRSGFYLHGGVMPGSSGCIDIGDTGIASVISILDGYQDAVPVTVKYTQAPPSVGALGRAAGRFMYPNKKNPSFWDRVTEAVGGD